MNDLDVNKLLLFYQCKQKNFKEWILSIKKKTQSFGDDLVDKLLAAEAWELKSVPRTHVKANFGIMYL